MNHFADRMLRHATALAFGLAVLILLASLIAVCLPEQPATPLLGKDGWETTTGFFNNSQPLPGEVRYSIVHAPDATYWRSWSPETNATRGTLVSRPFTAPRYMTVPYGGFAGEPGVEFYLACTANHRRMPLATANSGNQWTESVLRIPRGWCKQDVRIVVHTDSTKDYIKVGAPYKISAVSYFKATALGQLLPFLLSFGILAGTVLLLAWLFTGLKLARSPVTGGIAGLGLLGLGLFFLFYAWQEVAYNISIEIACASLLALASALVLQAKPRAAAGHFHAASKEWMELLALWLLVALAMYFLAHMAVHGAGPWEPNGRFSPARWASDNQIPILTSEQLYLGNDLHEVEIRPWKVSDRPPLMYGLLAMLRIPAALSMLGSDGQYAYYQAHLNAGIILNSLWVPVVAFIARRLGCSFAKQALIVGLLALTPFAIFNTAYIWPKLLGGAFGLLAFWVVGDYDPAKGFSRFTGSPRPLVEAALLCALALMSHGGTFFGILALLCWVPFVRGLPSLRSMLAAAVVAVAVLLPWSLWQQWVQPPGNTLLKYAFANTFDFNHPDRSVLEAILSTYGDLDLVSWLRIKWNALLTLAFGLRSDCGFNEMAAAGGAIAEQRISDFLYVGPSLNFLLAGLCVAPFAFLRNRRQGKPQAFALSLLALGLLGLLFNALVMLNCFVNHHQAYQSTLAILLGLVLLLLPAGRHARLALALSAAYATVVWILQPLREAHVRLEGPAMLGLAVVAAILGLIALGRLGSPPARSSGEAPAAPTMPPVPR